jgi:hypothetical protein
VNVYMFIASDRSSRAEKAVVSVLEIGPIAALDHGPKCSAATYCH